MADDEDLTRAPPRRSSRQGRRGRRERLPHARPRRADRRDRGRRQEASARAGLGARRRRSIPRRRPTSSRSSTIDSEADDAGRERRAEARAPARAPRRPRTGADVGASGSERANGRERARRRRPRTRRPRRSPGSSRSPASATASFRVEGSDDDVYVSASQVRRCEMKEGDEVTGPVRAPRRGERHRALVRVNLVNGEPPVDAPAPRRRAGERTPRPTASTRSRRSRPPGASTFPPTRARSCAPRTSWRPSRWASACSSRRRRARAGRRSFATSLRRSRAVEGLELTVLLIDERPEEVPAWSEAVPVGRPGARAGRPLAGRAGEGRALRRSSGRASRPQDGADAVLVCDSLSRLAVAGEGRRRRQAPLRLGPCARRGRSGHADGRRDHARRRGRRARGGHNDRDLADLARPYARGRGDLARARLQRVPRRRRRQDPLRRGDGRPSPPALEPLGAGRAGGGGVRSAASSRARARTPKS